MQLLNVATLDRARVYEYLHRTPRCRPSTDRIRIKSNCRIVFLHLGCARQDVLCCYGSLLHAKMLLIVDAERLHDLLVVRSTLVIHLFVHREDFHARKTIPCFFDISEACTHFLFNGVNVFAICLCSIPYLKSARSLVRTPACVVGIFR